MTASRLIRNILAASTLTLAALAIADAAPANTLEIVVGNGPHAGAYKPVDVICLHVKAQKQFSASFRDFNAPKPNAVGEGGISVSNFDDAGAKWGSIIVSFGDRDKNPTVYEVSIPRTEKSPLTVTRSGKETGLAFQGQTKDGIQLRVAATCLDTDEF